MPEEDKGIRQFCHTHFDVRQKLHKCVSVTRLPIATLDRLTAYKAENSVKGM